MMRLLVNTVLLLLVHSLRLTEVELMEVSIGKEVLGPDLAMQAALTGTDAASASSSVDQTTIQTILAGVERGNRESIYFFGLYKLHGIGLSKNQTIAASNFLRAADLGHIEAMTAFAVLCMNGRGVEQDYNKAVAYLRKAVGKGDVNAHWFLGKLLMEGKGVPGGGPQLEEAFQLLSLAAANNIADAEHLLGILYEYGKGTQIDFAKAFDMYQRASHQNHVESTYHMALMHAFGRGVPQNFKLATALFDQGARNDHAPSTYYVGIMKLYGYGCEPNYHLAMNWFERAAGMGDERIAKDALAAAEEVKKMLELAYKVDEETVAAYHARNSLF